MEDMEPFRVWFEGEKRYQRTLLLVDELPAMFDDSTLCIATLNEAETELDQLKTSYRVDQRAAKQVSLYHLSKSVRTPFFKLSRLLQCQQNRCGLVTEEMRAAADFQVDDLEYLQVKLEEYAEHTKAAALVGALVSGACTYYSTDQTFTVFVPRLKQIDRSHALATFLFSGTAELSPELTDNPDVTILSEASFEESYARLKIVARRGDGLSAAKTALSSGRNQKCILEWLRFILPPLTEQHRKLLVVTYQAIAQWLWLQLEEFHSALIPYIDNEGNSKDKLPYFGGMNGSNLYQEATCVICVGLNRFEPREYLNRALALDSDGETAQEMLSAAEEDRAVRCDHIPSVRHIEHVTLARDLVQLVFRSALRKHGREDPIELWLMNPPDAVLEYLKQYFGDCRIEEIPELRSPAGFRLPYRGHILRQRLTPLSCSAGCKAASSRYLHQRTSASKPVFPPASSRRPGSIRKSADTSRITSKRPDQGGIRPTGSKKSGRPHPRWPDAKGAQGSAFRGSPSLEYILYLCKMNI